MSAVPVISGTYPAGIVLPESTLQSEFFAVLAAFVAINTVMYAALAIAKIVPLVHVADLLPRSFRRSETRSIHPTLLPDTLAPATLAPDSAHPPAGVPPIS